MPKFRTETAQISIFRLSVGNYKARILKCAQNGLKSPDEFLPPQNGTLVAGRIEWRRPGSTAARG